MNRRTFLQRGAAGAAALGSPLSIGLAAAQGAEAAEARPSFRLNYAPHEGLFHHLAGDDVVDQIAFAAEQGFRGWEDNAMATRPVAEQERIAAALRHHGMQMGVFVAHTIFWQEPNLAGGDPALRAQFLDEIRASVEVAQRVGATWMTVVPGHRDPRLTMDYQTAYVVEALREAAAILEPHGLVMVLEPLNPLRDHPGLFLTRIGQAYQICRAVDSPACKILFDVYHQQITEGNLLPNIDRAWDEIAYFQLGDHPGRNEPTTGEINYRTVLAHIHAKGYTGLLGMEHGHARPGAEGQRAVLEAYRQVDGG